MQNATDAIEGRHEAGDRAPGHIRVDMHEEGNTVHLSVEDNGYGLPKEKRTRLTEPYVTTRNKGTGLGLAIVTKIMEEHHGSLILEDGTNGGARISLLFPKHGPRAAGTLGAAAE
jgi:two-component system nitrogen regulation sensor histidine kinase NtrY